MRLRTMARGGALESDLAISGFCPQELDPSASDGRDEDILIKG
jgi:hypothetical protein